MLQIRELPVPDLLVKLIAEGRWRHPGDDIIRRIVPMVVEPLIFLGSIERMDSESRTSVADDPQLSTIFRLYRGRLADARLELPWLDIDRAFFVAVNKNIGDDVAIALDFRTGVADPRVVASEYRDHEYWWRTVAPSFSQFVAMMGL
jgi:hypothetical protein